MNLLYCLYGLDQKRITKRRLEIIKELDADEMNISIFDMDVDSIDRALVDAYSVPFLKDYRVVVLKNCTFLSTVRKPKDDIDTRNNQNINALKEYIENPCLSTVLIMECPQETLDSKKNIVKAIKEKEALEEIKPFTSQEITSFINSFLKKKDIKIDYSAKSELIRRLADEPYTFMNELEKLLLYSASGELITTSVIKSLITESLNTNIFNLINAIMDRNRKKALDTYFELINQGIEPSRIFNFVISRFNQLLYAKEIILSGGSQSDIVEALKISSGQAYYLKEDARKIGYDKIALWIDKLKKLDYESKVSFKYGTDDTVGFELFLSSI